jgi:hypothetical protein
LTIAFEESTKLPLGRRCRFTVVIPETRVTRWAHPKFFSRLLRRGGIATQQGGVSALALSEIETTIHAAAFARAPVIGNSWYREG